MSIRVYAIVPAAGSSRRMGEPKLLLPWKSGTVIDAVLEVWQCSAVCRTVVVTRKEDTDLQSRCEARGAEVLTSEPDPFDMKESLLLGARYLQADCGATEQDFCFVGPADLPTVADVVVEELVRTIVETAGERGVVPMYGGRIGHPALLPIGVLNRLSSLSPEQGLRDLLAVSELTEVSFCDHLRPIDIDTPEEYRRLLEESD